MKLNFAVLYMSRTMGLTCCHKTESFYLHL